jgi:hypothetical protein
LIVLDTASSIDEAMNEVHLAHFARSRKLNAQFTGREIKIICDCFMATFKSADAAPDCGNGTAEEHRPSADTLMTGDLLLPSSSKKPVSSLLYLYQYPFHTDHWNL